MRRNGGGGGFGCWGFKSKMKKGRESSVEGTVRERENPARKDQIEINWGEFGGSSEEIMTNVRRRRRLYRKSSWR